MTPRRGEVWWVRLDPTLGAEIEKTRPCVVVGTNVVNERRRTIVIIPLSSSPQAAPPLLVPVVCEGRRAVAVVDQIRAAAKERFTRRLGDISPEDLTSVEDALRQILEL
jgi:mRNA interferase MazF